MRGAAYHLHNVGSAPRQSREGETSVDAAASAAFC